MMDLILMLVLIDNKKLGEIVFKYMSMDKYFRQLAENYSTEFPVELLSKYIYKINELHGGK